MIKANIPASALEEAVLIYSNSCIICCLIYHTFTLECKRNKGAIDYQHLRTGMIFDITVSRMNREETFKDTQRDPITGLYNRNGFMIEGEEYLNKSKVGGQRIVLICIQVIKLRKISMLFGAFTRNKAVYLALHHEHFLFFYH